MLVPIPDLFDSWSIQLEEWAALNLRSALKHGLACCGECRNQGQHCRGSLAPWSPFWFRWVRFSCWGWLEGVHRQSSSDLVELNGSGVGILKFENGVQIRHKPVFNWAVGVRRSEEQVFYVFDQLHQARASLVLERNIKICDRFSWLERLLVANCKPQDHWP